MTYAEFLTNIENYYGEYRNFLIKKILAEYLQKEIGENELDRLFILITDKYSNTYKTSPDKALIMKIVNEYNDDNFHIYSPKKDLKIGICYHRENQTKKITQ